MTAEAKAKKFIVEADKHGWESKIELRDDEAHVKCTRGGELIYIWWRGNSLIETPKYTLGGRTISLHNAAGALRQLDRKPDYTKTSRRTRIKPSIDTEGAGEIPIVRHTLPFDIHESTNSEILREIRGSRLVWLNKQTGVAESAHVPYKIFSKGTVRLMNTDTKNVFFLATGKDDRDYVSFMDAEGKFRAVYLDMILQVA